MMEVCAEKERENLLEVQDFKKGLNSRGFSFLGSRGLFCGSSYGEILIWKASKQNYVDR